MRRKCLHICSLTLMLPESRIRYLLECQHTTKEWPKKNHLYHSTGNLLSIFVFLWGLVKVKSFHRQREGGKYAATSSCHHAMSTRTTLSSSSLFCVQWWGKEQKYHQCLCFPLQCKMAEKCRVSGRRAGLCWLTANLLCQARISPAFSSACREELWDVSEVI